MQNLQDGHVASAAAARGMHAAEDCHWLNKHSPPRPPAPLCSPQSALIHLGLGQWAALVNDMDALDLLKPSTDK